MKYYVYHIGPIDFFVGAMQITSLVGVGDKEELSRHLRCLTKHSYWDAVKGITGMSEKYIELKLFLEALEAVNVKGFDGVFRDGEEFFAFSVPSDGCFQMGFVFKQNNNGCTFVASPVRMVHLEQL